MSKIAVVQGSPRNETTHHLYEKFIEMCGDRHEIVAADLIGKESVHVCVNCRKCAEDGYCSRYIAHGMNDYRIFEEFNSCSSLVIFTPIYFFQFPAQTKSVLDRLGGCSQWKGKELFLYTVSGSAGYMGGASLLIDSLMRTGMWHLCEVRGTYKTVTHDRRFEDFDEKMLKNLDDIVKKV